MEQSKTKKFQLSPAQIWDSTVKKYFSKEFPTVMNILEKQK